MLLNICFFNNIFKRLIAYAVKKPSIELTKKGYSNIQTTIDFYPPILLILSNIQFL